MFILFTNVCATGTTVNFHGHTGGRTVIGRWDNRIKRFTQIMTVDFRWFFIFSAPEESIPTSFIAAAHAVGECGIPLMIMVWGTTLSAWMAAFAMCPAVMVQSVIYTVVEMITVVWIGVGKLIPIVIVGGILVGLTIVVVSVVSSVCIGIV